MDTGRVSDFKKRMYEAQKQAATPEETSDKAVVYATAFKNPLGELRFCPTLPNGLVQDEQHKWIDNARGVRHPRLFKSKARAERVAKREWRRTKESEWQVAKQDETGRYV